ncbi:SMC-Scp complex subunit ScpB [Candidatus Woesearchaeota archaeon]|nr:SMC-Scp complex subunit ScpB [Candidatus Woesearchaeota archaeon]
MQDIKNKLEAVLFITGKSMTVDEMAQFCNIGSVGTVKEAILGLQKDFVGRPGSLEVTEEEGRYRLNIKREYNHLSTKLLSAADLDVPTQATLALIAYKQPILQSEIIKMRGNTAYDHIHALKAMEFIVSEKKGRTRSLKLGSKFFDYFDVVEEQFKRQMQETFEKQEKLIPETKTEEKTTHPVIEEKTSELIPIIVLKEKKKKNIPTQEKVRVVTETTLEVERTPKEVLLRINADDFGSKC